MYQRVLQNSIFKSDNVLGAIAVNNVYVPAYVTTDLASQPIIPKGVYKASVMFVGKTQDFTVWASESESYNSTNRIVSYVVENVNVTSDNEVFKLYTSVAQYYDAYIIYMKK